MKYLNLSKVATFILILATVNCSNTNTIEIGFIGDFSGESRDLAEHCRNGTELAIHDINKSGGISGKQLVLKTIDVKVDNYKDTELPIIIGPILSKRVDELIKNFSDGTIFISPSVSSDKFTNIDDNLIMMNSPASIDGEKLADDMINKGLTKTLIIISNYNIEYTEEVAKGAIRKLEYTNITPYSVLVYSKIDEFIEMLSLEVIRNIDSVLISSLGDEAGRIIQHITQLNSDIKFYGCQWTKTTNVLNYGGKAVEGFITIGNTKYEDSKFFLDYSNRYKSEPNFLAIHSYESIIILKEAFKNKKFIANSKYIKESILQTQQYKGINESFSLNKFGDSTRRKELLVIKNGKYEVYNKKTKH